MLICLFMTPKRMLKTLNNLFTNIDTSYIPIILPANFIFCQILVLGPASIRSSSVVLLVLSLPKYVPENDVHHQLILEQFIMMTLLIVNFITKKK